MSILQPVYDKINDIKTTVSKFIKYAKIVALVLLLLVLWSLVGCATTEKVVTKNEIKVVEIPRHLLEKCKVTKPPYSPDSFAALSKDERVKVLSEYNISLLGDLKTCDNRLDLIEDYQRREVDLIKKATQ